MLLLAHVLLLCKFVIKHTHSWLVDVWQPKAGLEYMYIDTIDNHTIKYESQSLVVGDGVAYKRIFRFVSPCKNNWEFVCRSETISS